MSDAADRINMDESWKSRLFAEFEQPYMRELREFLIEERRQGKVIFPRGDEIFNAFNSAPFESVRVVILGQDPYHGPGQAHGLCFSVRPGVQLPPSLRNIYREISDDVHASVGKNGCLQCWADQGVLLLNSVLTVEQGKAAAHQGKGWEQFTDRAIELLNRERNGVVFLLWGSYAQKKGQFIDRERHLVLKSPHPSPLSASRGFFGNHHFSRANEFLESRGLDPIDWSVPDERAESRLDPESIDSCY